MALDYDNGSSLLGDINVHISQVNDAPSLLDGALGNIPEDTVEPSGEIISIIFGGRFSDVDGTFSAIAISADATDAINPQGVWQYSTNDGSGWYPLDVRDASDCLLYTSPSPRDATLSRMPSSA